MSPRAFLVLGLLVTACGESLPGARSPTSGDLPPASGRFVLHADIAPAVELNHAGVGFRGAADVGFEAHGCCGLALYAGQTALTSEAAANRHAKKILDGGLELHLAPSIPSIDDRLRMRVRAGKAGTPPYLTSEGRSGFAASGALIFRLWDVDPPAVNHGAPGFDILVEYYGWSLGREQTSAGPREDSASFLGSALVLGLRVGLDYGVELK